MHDLVKIAVDLHLAAHAAMFAKTGRRTVSQVFIGDTHVGGHDDLMSLDRDGRPAVLFN